MHLQKKRKKMKKKTNIWRKFEAKSQWIMWFSNEERWIEMVTMKFLLLKSFLWILLVNEISPSEGWYTFAFSSKFFLLPLDKWVPLWVLPYQSLQLFKQFLSSSKEGISSRYSLSQNLHLRFFLVVSSRKYLVSKPTITGLKILFNSI